MLHHLLELCKAWFELLVEGPWEARVWVIVGAAVSLACLDLLAPERLDLTASTRAAENLIGLGVVTWFGGSIGAAAYRQDQGLKRAKEQAATEKQAADQK